MTDNGKNIEMNNEEGYGKEAFLSYAHACGLSPEGPYLDKLFAYVKTMLDRNKLLYEIDVSDIEPVSVIDCILEDRIRKQEKTKED